MVVRQGNSCPFRHKAMPRVEHRKAAKDYPNSNIKKGEKYYTWKFRFGGRRRQKERPLPEQLTQSGYLQEWYPLQREIESPRSAVTRPSVARTRRTRSRTGTS